MVALAASLVAASSRAELDRERRERKEIEQVAGGLATALLTFDHSDLDATKQRVLSFATGKFRREYEQAFDGGLRTLLTETKATSRGTVTSIYVGDVDDGTAGAIVVADAVADGTAGRRRTLASYIQLDLVKVDGRWRVDGVTDLNFGSGTGSAAPAGAPPG
jgi:Mce-associated membrane protein